MCVSYYGSGVPGMLDRLDDVTCPTLFHFGADDAYIPAEGVEALAAAIDGRPASCSTSRPPATPSTTTSREMFYDEAAAKAAWSKTMAFLAEHLPPR